MPGLVAGELRLVLFRGLPLVLGRGGPGARVAAAGGGPMWQALGGAQILSAGS